jgi:dolichol-phosphate mannosyltransferase
MTLKRLRGALGEGIVDSNGFDSSLELLLKAVHSGGFVTEVPILLDYGKKGGNSKMRLFSTIVKYVVLILKFKRLTRASSSRQAFSKKKNVT